MRHNGARRVTHVTPAIVNYRPGDSRVGDAPDIDIDDQLAFNKIRSIVQICYNALGSPSRVSDVTVYNLL